MDATITLIVFILLSVIIGLANLERHHAFFKWTAIAVLVALNALLLLLGLFSFVPTGVALPGLPAEALDAVVAFFRAMGITGLLAFLPLLPPLRRFLARWLPIDPDSAVHTVALVYAVYLVGSGIGQQPLATDPEALGSLDNVAVTPAVVWSQALGMALLALTGVGFVTRRTWRETAARLGLVAPTLGQVGLAAATVVGLFLLQGLFVAGWRAIDPAGLQRIEDASNLLLGSLTGLGGALTIGLAAALGEELIFRGAMQPVFLLLPTALLFTVLHSQYGFSPATLLILLIALILGFLRNRTNLTVCILVHFGYNFASALLPNLGQ